MPASTRPAADSTPEQLRFPSIPGCTVRADFAGGELSSDLGAVVLGAVDRRIGLIDRLTAAIAGSRDTRYITHPMRDLLKQRVFQIASGYEGGNDADTLRADPLFKLAAGRAPPDSGNRLACGATHSRLEGALRRSDIYRIARALVEQFIAGYREAPASITPDMDHTDDAAHGRQELSFYNHHYGRYCYLPPLVFEAGSGALVTAVLRVLRQHWPRTHILLRGDGHFSDPELMRLVVEDGNADFIFGLPAKDNQRYVVTSRDTLLASPAVCGSGCEAAIPAPDAAQRRVMAATSLRGPTPGALYQRVYCQRGQAENFIKQLKCDLKSGRTSASTFTANFSRLLLAGAAYVLHQQLRLLGLRGTELAAAQPKTVILSLFKIAVRVKQHKDRVLLHLPGACPVKALLAKVCRRLCPNRRAVSMSSTP